ncbi:MAG: branched-chain amino acid ABC transporter permease [Chloroflexi bacterium]|nr:branched-chain amino acid ABC transporter permease [Chloroflexota bacterium]
MIVILLVFVLFASNRLEFSRVGRAWKAIREDETAASFMGVNLTRAKLLAFGLGASFSGLAGAVFASMLNAIVPDMFQFQVSIFLLIIVILSGLGSVWGCCVFDGVFLAQILPALLPDSDVQSLRWVFFGFGLVAFMILRPQGLFGAAIKKRGAPALTVKERNAA